MNVFYKVIIMVFLMFFTAAVSTAVLCREMLCQANTGLNFYISALAAAVAAVLAGVLSRKYLKGKNKTYLNIAVSFTAIAAAFAAMGGLFFIRYFRAIFSIPAAATVPAWADLIMPLAAWIPFGALLAACLAACVKLSENENAKQPLFTGFIALLGAVSGLLIYRLFLWKYYSNLNVLYVSGMASLAAIYILFRDKTMEGRYTMLGVIGALIFYLAFNVGGFKDRADVASNRANYRGYEIIAEKEYPTVKFVMAKKDGEYFVFENGSLTYTMHDKKYAEMAKLAQGANILIINGGPAGLIGELAKTPSVKEIISVEADPYTSFILGKISGNSLKTGKKIYFRSGNAAEDMQGGGQGMRIETVFVNPRKASGGLYSKKFFLKLKENLLVPGGRVVVSAPADEADAVKKIMAEVFGNAGDAGGFIIAQSDALKGQ